MKTEIIAKAGRLVSKAGLQIKKHSPEIFMVAGIAGTVASTVMACKATTKLNDILDETKKTVDVIHSGMENGNINNVEYTQEDGKKDLTITYTQTGIKLAKLYGPSVILGTLSIASIVNGHRILKKRNVALAAAYAVVDNGFKNYRKNVVERFGEAIDKELRYNIKAQEIETEVVDKKGNVKTQTEVVNVATEISDYARFFDEGCSAYEKDAEYNLMFLRRQQDYANDMLRSKGHLFLNEVYDMLGIPRSRTGAIAGWIYDEKHPIGDNYVDFGIYENREANRRFINGQEYNILLDFNCDGIIYDKI